MDFTEEDCVIVSEEIGRQQNVGGDTLGVRRELAPDMKPYTIGSKSKALRLAADPLLRLRALRRVRRGFYANSTRGPRAKKLQLVIGIIKASGASSTR